MSDDDLRQRVRILTDEWASAYAPASAREPGRHLSLWKFMDALNDVIWGEDDQGPQI